MLAKTAIFLHLIGLSAHLQETKAQSGAVNQLGSKFEKDIEVDIYEQERRTRVVGAQDVTWTGGTYYTFRGIPYAEKPIGERRFKDPVPLTPLPERIDARYEGHDCPAPFALNASEDCLTLNVYTPQLSNSSALPVLVFIHPGGLYVGSSLSSFLGPAYLLTHPMVLVTFNYRLGTLGFLQLGTRDIPGNAGFKDQVLALRWVQRHIQQFGGNAGDVTVMGYSAGGLSVGLHLVSPMSRGLFHKAILMSGALPAQTPVPRHAQMALMRKQAEALQCVDTENSKNILTCLQQHSGAEMAATLRQLFDFNKNHPIYLWLPVIEQDFEHERFLSENPWDSLRAGDIAQVPVLVGFTNGEFCRSAWDIVRNAPSLLQLEEHFDELAPKIFMYDDATGNATKTAQASAQLRAHYLAAADMAENPAHLCDFISDAIVRFGAQRLAELAAPHTPVFAYKFAYRGAHSNFNYDTKGEDARTEHMDDLMYLFRIHPHHFEPHEPDAEMVRVYTKFMFDFMQNGKIQASNATTALPRFPKAYALINSTDIAYESGTFLAADTYNLWRRLFL